MGGWPLAFYIFGLLGILWFVFWIFLIYDTPSCHPRICRREQSFILASIGPQVQFLISFCCYILTVIFVKDEDEKSTIPWCKLFTCLPLWAILVTQCGQSWAFYTQLTELPTYMSQILHFDIQQVKIEFISFNPNKFLS